MAKQDSQPHDRHEGPFSAFAKYRGHLAVGVVALLATNIAALSIPYFLGRIIEALRGDPEPAKTIPPLAMMILGLALVQAITRIASRVSIFNAARMAEYDLRSKLFEHLLTLDNGYYQTHSTGDVMSRLTNDIQTVRGMYGPGLLNLVNTIFIFSVALFLMINIDVKLTLWALLPYPSMLLLGNFFGKRIYKYSRAVQSQLGTLSTLIQEDLSGIAIVKAYTLEEQRLELFRTSSSELIERNMAATKIRGTMVPILGAIASIATVIVLYVGGKAVIDDKITLGQMIQFSAYLGLLVWPTLALGWMISLFQRGKASWARLRSILDTKATIQSGPNKLDAPTKGHIEIKNLQLVLGDNHVLRDVSLELLPGTTTALVGRTGSGKTMLAESIPRLKDIAPDTIFIDGQDITSLDLLSLRSAIGYAPQEAFLFSASIEDNILMGVERRDNPPDDAVPQAAKAAGLLRDIDAFPDRFDTLVGERGITLSGGQRQRVALARALATEASIFILDDSLSAVDTETEKEILDALAPILSSRTSLIISHRVAAIERADQIIVLDEGKIVERGNHQKLLAQDGLYAEIYQAQLESDVLR